MSIAGEARTMDEWARAYVESTSLAYKFAPAAMPATFATNGSTTTRQGSALRPGRPAELRVVWDKYKAPKSAHALSSPQKRAHLLHTFFHHELQAAELMCWAVLSFPDTPPSFRRGLLSICQDEIRHMKMYSDHIERLGYRIGDFPVRDWFWERTPHASTAVEFVALMGLGFEAANLDHTARFAEMFRKPATSKARSCKSRSAKKRSHMSHSPRTGFANSKESSLRNLDANDPCTVVAHGDAWQARATCRARTRGHGHHVPR